MAHDHSFIGKNIRRFDAPAKLTGDALFAADLRLDNPLCLKVLRSAHHHARIRDIDLSAALGLDGVAGIFTAKDIPGKNLIGIINKDQPLLARDKVRSKADPVALVAARDEDCAQQALKAIRVAYEELPAVFDPDEALAPDAPAVHDKGNLLCKRAVTKGDVDAAFRDCASIIEETYQTPAIEHNYLEPDAGAGYVDEEGCLVIYASTQNPHYDHKELTSLLDLADDRVRIIMAAVGGGFGSKLDLNVQGFIGLALYHLKQPVRYVYSREEAYLATGKRHPFKITVKTGTDSQGKLLAARIRAVCNTGAYGSYGMAVASRSTVTGMGPYQVNNVDIQCRAVYTNTTFCGAMRGFGAPQMALAHESQMDRHAQDLGMDPWEIRKINGFTPGAVTATGQTLGASVGFPLCLDAVKPHYDDALSDWVKQPVPPFVKRGVGIGGMWYGIGNTGVQNPSTARVEMDTTGKITVFTGCADIGQGSTTVLAQIAAQVLGTDPADIHMVVGDTRYTTNAGATSASRQTYISGNAVREAAGKLAEVLFTEAVNKLKRGRAPLKMSDGCVFDAADPDHRIGFGWLARRISDKGGSLSWQGYFDPDTIPLDPETGQGKPYATYAYACHLACVEVDTLTGQVAVKKVVAAHDVGRAVHPDNIAGQIRGGVAMGVGFALMEEFVPGATLSMKDYHVPTIADMPEVVPIIIESPEPTGPFGAKGVGEPALIPTAPAVVNALSMALGQRITRLPADLERVLAAGIASGHFNIAEDSHV